MVILITSKYESFNILPIISSTQSIQFFSRHAPNSFKQDFLYKVVHVYTKILKEMLDFLLLLFSLTEYFIFKVLNKSTHLSHIFKPSLL